MFVWKSTYRALKCKFDILFNVSVDLKVEVRRLNRLVRAIKDQILRERRERSGTRQGYRDKTPSPDVSGFSKAEIEVMIKLCHPDKHNNSSSANEMTKILLTKRK